MKKLPPETGGRYKTNFIFSHDSLFNSWFESENADVFIEDCYKTTKWAAEEKIRIEDSKTKGGN